MQQEKLTIVNFGTRFKELVDQDELSQKEIAAKLGISEGSIVNYKRDRIPKAEELLAIASLYGVTMEWLLTGRGSRTIDEIISTAESYASILGISEMTAEQRAGAQRILKKRDAPILWDEMERRVLAAEEKLRLADKKLEDIKKIFESE